MNINDILWLSYNDLHERILRTTLTIIMVVIGVASIIALVSQTSGINQSIQNSLNTLGPTSIIVMPAGSGSFTSQDTSEISSLPNVVSVIPILSAPVYINLNGNNESATLIGINTEGLRELLGTINIYQGGLYQNTVTPSSLLGYRIAFPEVLAGTQGAYVGQPASLSLSEQRQAITVPIVGILQNYGNIVIPIDSGVIMSVYAAETILHRTSYNIMLVKATNTGTVGKVSQTISQIYGARAKIITVQQLIQITSQILNQITVLFIVIASISLLVAAIGIMNIMLISVFERTHEIGVLKALGFMDNEVMMIFLFEAVTIGVLGGFIGIAVGIMGSYSLTALIIHTSTSSSSSISQFSQGVGGSSISYYPIISLSTLLIAMAVAVIVSIIAGIYPAWRASKMKPIEALRHI
jgi:ABC-type antimicrobial peptide transport system permease subunit